MWITGIVPLRSFMSLLLDMIYAENYMSMIIKWISIALAVASVLFFVMLIMITLICHILGSIRFWVHSAF